MKIPNAIIKIGFPVVILFLAVGIAGFLKNNGPEAKKEKSAEQLLSVEYTVAKRGNYQTKIQSRGSVRASQSSIVSAEVSGLVTVSEQLEVGAIFQAGDVMLQIEASDYSAALAEVESRLADAEVALQTEVARATQARRDWKKLGGNRKPDPLVLREPQLAAAKARLKSVQEARAKAARDLQKTKIVAPYDCRIIQQMVDDGALASVGGSLLKIESVNDFEVRLPIRVAEFSLLEKNAKGALGDSSYTLTSRSMPGAVWKETKLRSEDIIDESTRSIHVVAKVSALAEDKSSRMLTGVFVDVEIAGRELKNVVAVPRNAFISRKQLIVLNDDEKLKSPVLKFRDVEVVRFEGDLGFVSKGLSEGDRVVVTSIDSPLEKQKVRATERGKKSSKSQSENEGGQS